MSSITDRPDVFFITVMRMVVINMNSIIKRL